MYVPPFEAILRNIDISKSDFETSSSVEIPRTLLEFLLRIALVSADFDEVSYLGANPDVAKATKSGTVKSPRLHYIGNGYFEGRQGGSPELDEKWYLSSYPDVADAVRRRATESGAQHFQTVGVLELRAPAEAYLTDAVEWGKALGKG
jgi:hypothetical protein